MIYHACIYVYVCGHFSGFRRSWGRMTWHSVPWRSARPRTSGVAEVAPSVAAPEDEDDADLPLGGYRCERLLRQEALRLSMIQS